MPVLIRFLLRHAAIGIGLASLFVGALTVLDMFHLGSLMRGSPDGLLALAVLTAALGITFGSVQMGFAVMLMGEDEQPPKGRRAPLARPVPRPVKVRSRR